MPYKEQSWLLRNITEDFAGKFGCIGLSSECTIKSICEKPVPKYVSMRYRCNSVLGILDCRQGTIHLRLRHLLGQGSKIGKSCRWIVVKKLPAGGG